MRSGDKRRLGRTKLALPVLGFGAAPLGNLFARIAGQDAHAILETAWERGIRYFDTSPFYGFGLSEHRVGHFLQELDRSAFHISTKVGRVFQRIDGEAAGVATPFWPHPLPFSYRFDYSYDGIMRSYEDSTQRLGISRIDMLFIHDLDYWALETEQRVVDKLRELESGWKALESLRRTGEIGAVGAGINEAGMMTPLIEGFDLDCLLVAQPYTLLDQETLDDAFPLCARRGIGVIIGAPFASGILATGAIPGAKYRYGDPAPEVLQRVGRMSEIGRRYNVPLAAAALQFPLAHPVVTSVIPGAREPGHVRDTVAAIETPIPEAYWQALKRERLIRDDAPVPA